MSHADTRGLEWPSRSCRSRKARTFLQDTIEIVLAANGFVGFGVGGVERDPQFVELGFDQCTSVLLIENGAVGIEQDIGAAILQVAHHARQILHQHRFADTVQDGARKVRDLIDNGAKELPAHVGRRLELFIGSRAGGAQKVAAVGRLQIEAHGIVLRPIAVGAHTLEVTPRIDRRFRLRRIHQALPRGICGTSSGRSSINAPAARLRIKVAVAAG